MVTLDSGQCAWLGIKRGFESRAGPNLFTLAKVDEAKWFFGYMTFRPMQFQPMHFQPLPFQPLTISTYCIFNRPPFQPKLILAI